MERSPDRGKDRGGSKGSRRPGPREIPEPPTGNSPRPRERREQKGGSVSDVEPEASSKKDRKTEMWTLNQALNITSKPTLPKELVIITQREPT